jgi:hypothetical protein
MMMPVKKLACSKPYCTCMSWLARRGFQVGSSGGPKEPLASFALIAVYTDATIRVVRRHALNFVEVHVHTPYGVRSAVDLRLVAFAISRPPHCHNRVDEK